MHSGPTCTWAPIALGSSSRWAAKSTVFTNILVSQNWVSVQIFIGGLQAAITTAAKAQNSPKYVALPSPYVAQIW